jgi:uncharacterized protein YecE (DUF72 family)
MKRFVEAAPKDIMLAVEFRHLSWLRSEVNELLREHKIANTIVDEPLLPPTLNITADFSVVRWHGKGVRPWYNYRYSDKELETWKPRLAEISRKTKIYGYFNNHFHGFAIENSLKTLEMIGAASQEQREILKSVSNYLEKKDAMKQKPEGSLLDYMSNSAR